MHIINLDFDRAAVKGGKDLNTAGSEYIQPIFLFNDTINATQGEL